MPSSELNKGGFLVWSIKVGYARLVPESVEHSMPIWTAIYLVPKYLGSLVSLMKDMQPQPQANPKADERVKDG